MELIGLVEAAYIRIQRTKKEQRRPRRIGKCRRCYIKRDSSGR